MRQTAEMMSQFRKPKDDMESSSTDSSTPPLAVTSSLSAHGRPTAETPMIVDASSKDQTATSPDSLIIRRQRPSDLHVNTISPTSSSASPVSATSPFSQLQQRRPSPNKPTDENDAQDSPRRTLEYHTASRNFQLPRRRKQRRSVGILLGFSVLATLWSTFFVLLQQHVVSNNENKNDRTDRSFDPPTATSAGSSTDFTKEYVRQELPKDGGSNERGDLNQAEGFATHVVVLEADHAENLTQSDAISDQVPTATLAPVDTTIISSERMLPRIIHFPTGDDAPAEYNPLRILEDDPMLHAPPGFEAAPQDRMKPDETLGNCEPMHEWQTRSFPNCNSVHEIDMHSAGVHVGKDHEISFEDQVQLLGAGWFRQTWRWDKGTTDESIVLKTLRLDREFYDEFFDLHRRDAVAMERLSHSAFVMNIYGYCGQSAINELADFGFGGITSLEKFNRNMRGNNSPEASLLKLQVASSVAVGLAHVHEIDLPDSRPSMVHYDMNPRNIAIVKGGRPKLNDFNTAEFLRWDATRNATCGFPSRLHEPWWRAPEEVDTNDSTHRFVNEKLDVYALGNILFHILTTHSPRGKMKKERMEEVRKDVLIGKPPQLPEAYVHSHDPATKAIREAMKLCHVFEPEKRASSRQVASILLDALIKMKKGRKQRPTKLDKKAQTR